MANKSGTDRRFFNVRWLVEGIANDSTSTEKYRQYIVGPAPTGNFADFPTNAIAYLQDDGTWIGLPAMVGDAEVIDLSANAIKAFNGTEWVIRKTLGGGGGGGSDAFVDPVEAMVTSGATLPTLPGDYEVGDKFVNTADNKVYTVQAGGATWDAGVTPADGERYADTTTGRVMQYNAANSAFDVIALVDSAAFVDSATNTLWIYDGPTNSFIQGSGTGSIPVASYTVLGGVTVKKDGGGISVTGGQLSLNRIYGEFEIEVTEAHISAGLVIELPQNYILGREANVAMTVGCIRQRYEVDFGVQRGNAGEGQDPTKSYLFDNGGLSAILLIAGDVLQIGYEYDPVIP